MIAFSFKKIIDSLTNKSKLVIENKNDLPDILISDSLIQIAINEGFNEQEAKQGFAIFDSYGGLHIEKLDCMEVYENDFEAAVYAETKYGIKIIRDLPECMVNSIDCHPYIDTKENREKIKEYIKLHYNKEWN